MTESALRAVPVPSLTVEEAVRAIERATGKTAKRRGDRWMCHCPAHEDRRPSLSVTAGDRQPVVLNCFAGCTSEAVCNAAGLDLRELCRENRETAVYRYGWRRKVRVKNGTGRTFYFDNAKGDTAGTYYLEDLIGLAREEGSPLYVTEGERDAERVNAQDGRHYAVTTGGAESWDAGHVEKLAGLELVRIVQDRDEPGRAAGRARFESLRGKVGRVELLEPATGKDVADHLEDGRDLAELVTVEAFDGTYPLADLDAWRAAADEPTPYLIRPWLTDQTITLVAGHAGAGKSVLLLNLAAAFATGGKFLGRWTLPRKRVLYFDLELSERQQRRRFNLIESEFGRLDGLSFVLTEGAFDPDRFSTTVERLQPEVVIFDPLTRALHSLGYDENKPETQGFFVDHLYPIRATGALVLVAHHSNKPEGGADGRRRGLTQHQVRGSTAIVAAVDEAWLLAGLGGMDRQLAHVKTRGELDPEDAIDLNKAPESYVLTTPSDTLKRRVSLWVAQHYNATGEPAKASDLVERWSRAEDGQGKEAETLKKRIERVAKSAFGVRVVKQAGTRPTLYLPADAPRNEAENA